MRRELGKPASARIKLRVEGFPSTGPSVPALAIPYVKAHNGDIQQNPVVEDL